MAISSIGILGDFGMLPGFSAAPSFSSVEVVCTFPPDAICILLCFEVPALPTRKEVNGVKEFTSGASQAPGLSGFICFREPWGCQGGSGFVPGAGPVPGHRHKLG